MPEKANNIPVKQENRSLSRLQALPEGLPAGISRIDYAIYVARQEPTLGQLLAGNSDKEKLKEEIGKVVYLAIFDFGITKLPDTEYQARILHYILKYFRDFTLSELELGFEFPLAGITEVNQDHFNFFSIRFMCSMLFAYRQKRMRSSSKLNILKEIFQKSR